MIIATKDWNWFTCKRCNKKIKNENKERYCFASISAFQNDRVCIDCILKDLFGKVKVTNDKIMQTKQNIMLSKLKNGN